MVVDAFVAVRFVKNAETPLIKLAKKLVEVAFTITVFVAKKFVAVAFVNIEELPVKEETDIDVEDPTVKF